MLIYRATSFRPGQLSPGKMLSQRKYWVLLPIHQYLHPNLEISGEAQIAQKQAWLRPDDYDPTAKKLQDLQQFQSVRFQLDPKKPIWRKVTVVQQPTKVYPGDMRYRLNQVHGTSGIDAIFVRWLRSNHKNYARPHLFPEQNKNHRDLDLPNILAQRRLMSLTRHHQSHCPNSVYRKRPRLE